MRNLAIALFLSTCGFTYHAAFGGVPAVTVPVTAPTVTAQDTPAHAPWVLKVDVTVEGAVFQTLKYKQHFESEEECTYAMKGPVFIREVSALLDMVVSKLGPEAGVGNPRCVNEDPPA